MHKAKIITVASGKGGVGKSIFCANFAYLLNQMGYKVAILDANFGLPSQDIIFNVTVDKTFTDLLKASADMAEVIIEIKEELYLIPIDSSDEICLYDGKYIVDRFLDETTLLDKIDYLIIDSAPSIDPKTQELFKISDHIIILSTNDPASITSSYTSLKIASKYCDSIGLVLNMTDKKEDATLIFNKIKNIILKHSDNNIEIAYLGYISPSNYISRSSLKRALFVKEYPNSLATYQLNETIYNFFIKLEHKVLNSKVKKSFSVIINHLIEKF